MDSASTDTRPRCVVVGYDGSPTARSALSLAVRRIGPEGRVFVVHSIEPPSATLGWTPADRKLAREQRAAETLRTELEQAMGDELSGVDWEWELMTGDPVDGILDVADTRAADEIVVGSRGHGAAGELLGSVAHKLLRRADRPVTVVPVADRSPVES